MEHPQRLQRLQHCGDRHELAVQHLERMIKRRRRAIGVGNTPLMLRITIDVVRNALRAVRQCRVDQIPDLLAVRDAWRMRRCRRARHPATGLDNIHKRQPRDQRPFAHERQIEEIVRIIACIRELVVIVTQQAWPHDLHKLSQMLLIGNNFFSLYAQLLIVGIRGKQINVGEMRRITLAEIGDKPSKRGKCMCAWFIRQMVGIQRGVLFHTADQFVERLAQLGVVERLGFQQRVAEQPAQAVALDNVQLLLVTPYPVPAALNQLCGRGVIHRRAAGKPRPGPVANNRRPHLPRRCGSRRSRIFRLACMTASRGQRHHDQDSEARKCHKKPSVTIFQNPVVSQRFYSNSP
ncbi:MAG: hypothetical protein BWY57_03315 [Betaproteobacteria bacterium ADurb.Bin341]|nr:MAG: hypothetical protein BWY57_03315 [Betaproteobacteria bacterium ADurb.Bin341]